MYCHGKEWQLKAESCLDRTKLKSPFSGGLRVYMGTTCNSKSIATIPESIGPIFEELAGVWKFEENLRFFFFDFFSAPTWILTYVLADCLFE